MMLGHGGAEGDGKDGRTYSRSRTAEKYMNTDAIDVEDRAAGTRMPTRSVSNYACIEIGDLSLL